MEYIFIAILGLLIGSFLNVVIIRIPTGENIAFPASHCVKCNTPLKPYHNIPLFSWLFLRGKCAFCKEKISYQYPLIELLSSMIFVAVFLKMGISWPTLGIAFVFLLLLAMTVIDLYYQVAPDSLNLLALTIAIISVFSASMLLNNFINALLFAGGFTLIRFYLSYAIQKEAMGEADIMIAATMGALLGIQLTLFAVFLSALIALPAMLLLQRNQEESVQVAFIPFLALATFITFIYDTQIHTYLGHLYG